MRLYEKRRRRRRRQKLIISSIFAICALGLTILLVICAKTRSGASGEPTEVPEVIRLDLPTVKTTPDAAILPETVEPENSYPRFSYSKDWGAEDSYLLAKIAMAEAEGESIHHPAVSERSFVQSSLTDTDRVNTLHLLFKFRHCIMLLHLAPLVHTSRTMHPFLR